MMKNSFPPLETKVDKMRLSWQVWPLAKKKMMWDIFILNASRSFRISSLPSISHLLWNLRVAFLSIQGLLPSSLIRPALPDTTMSCAFLLLFYCPFLAFPHSVSCFLRIPHGTWLISDLANKNSGCPVNNWISDYIYIYITLCLM